MGYELHGGCWAHSLERDGCLGVGPASIWLQGGREVGRVGAGGALCGARLGWGGGAAPLQARRSQWSGKLEAYAQGLPQPLP